MRVPSISFGVRSAHVTVGRRGVTRTVGVPGSDAHDTSHSGHRSGAHVDGLAVVMLLTLIGLVIAGIVLFR